VTLVRVRRQRALRGAIVPYRVDVGREVLTRRLWLGRSIECDLVPGPHLLTVWSGWRRLGTGRIEVDRDGPTQWVIGPERPSGVRS